MQSLRMKVIKVIIAMIVLAIGQSQATMVKVPDKIDFANTMTSFKYSDSAQSADGKKRDWFAWLMPNGKWRSRPVILSRNRLQIGWYP